MLSEKRVLQMTKMEMRRVKSGADIHPFLNLDKKDYVSFHDVLSFVVGTLFYLFVCCAVLLGLFYYLAENISRASGILIGVVTVTGYIIFIFLYRKWYHRHILLRYSEARTHIKTLKRDWEILEDIYREEEESTKPSVDLDMLFPEGSLGENE